MLNFYIKVFYVMGKALPGELSCPCDRSCCLSSYSVSSVYEEHFCFKGIPYFGRRLRPSLR